MSENYWIAQPNRTLIYVHGEDTPRFLQGIITNNIEYVTPSHSIYSLMLTPQGKFLYDFFISSHKEGFVFDIDANIKATFLKKLKMYKLRAKVTLEDISESYEVITYIGSEALNTWGLSNTGDTIQQDNITAYVDPRFTAMGVRCIAPRDAAPQEGFTQGDSATYTMHRLQCGMPEGGIDMISEQDFPLPFGMEALHAVDFKKGCYVGQEVTARSKHRGNIRKGIYTVASDTPLPEFSTNITTEGKKLGTLLSSNGQHGIALMHKEDLAKTLENNAEIKADNAVITLTLPEWV